MKPGEAWKSSSIKTDDREKRRRARQRAQQEAQKNCIDGVPLEVIRGQQSRLRDEFYSRNPDLRAA